MSGRTLAAAFVLVIIVSTGAGYLVGPHTTTTRTMTKSSTVTKSNTVTETISHLDASQEVQSACTYLTSNYNPSMGLIAETPGHARYYLYPDNFLAAIVMAEYCNNPSLTQVINKNLSEYNPSTIPNQFMAFGCKSHFQGSEDYDLSGRVWTSVNNQTSAPLNESYADVAFLQAYYDKVCVGNASAALVAFNAAAKEYDGIGFNDVPFRAESNGTYQTYKLALYVFAAELLNQTAPLSALTNLAKMQAPDGGFYTGYDANLSTNGASTNTETTCLAIMVLEAAFG